MSDILGFYKLLGVSPTASQAAIKAAHRRKAMQLHPDRNPGHDTTADFQRLQAAYFVLSDGNLRKKYDDESRVSSATNNPDRNSKNTGLASTPGSMVDYAKKPKSENLIGKASYAPLIFLAVFSGWVFLGGYVSYSGFAEKEKARAEKEAIERARLAEEAAQKAAELKRSEKPLPPSGIYSMVSFANPKRSNSAPLKIENAPGANTLLKLIGIADGVEIMSVFIRAGQTIEVSVPLGTYKAKTASGQIWYGDAIRFGPETAYAMLDAQFNFFIDGDRLVGNSLVLTHVRNGNLREIKINASDF